MDQLYMIKNHNGMKVELLRTGATIHRILVPHSGGLQNIVLTFQDQQDYLNNTLYLGATLGPTAGRIRNGVLPINDERHQLTTNSASHHLHGGLSNVSFQNWTVVEYSDYHIIFSLFLRDGLDGYPGNRTIHVTYTLDADDRLVICYQAFSDKDTYFNLSNHTYFNLGSPVLEHHLYINADYYIKNDDEHIPLEFSKVSSTPFDFTTAATLKEQIEKYPNAHQIQCAKGYNHAFSLNRPNRSTSPCASLTHQNCNFQVDLYTDAPGLVIYSGGFIDNNYLLEQGFSSSSCGIAMEAQQFPDAPNHTAFSYEITKADVPYTRSICYAIKKR